MDEGRLKISKMESDEVNVSTENGEVNTSGLKSHNIHIKTKQGHITADGSMQGNIFINAKKTVSLKLFCTQQFMNTIPWNIIHNQPWSVAKLRINKNS